LLSGFASFYIRLDGYKVALRIRCILVIGLDGYHLKTTYGEQLLIVIFVVVRNLNNHIILLAFVVVQTISKELRK